MPAIKIQIFFRVVFNNNLIYYEIIENFYSIAVYKFKYKCENYDNARTRHIIFYSLTRKKYVRNSKFNINFPSFLHKFQLHPIKKYITTSMNYH